VILVIAAIMVIHRFVIAPGLTADQYGEFEQRASYYAAAPTVAISTFVCAWYAIRRLKSGFVLNGLLIGTVATVLTLGFMVTARPEDRLMYLVSYVARIVAGYAAGVVARKKGSIE
jgi:putative membrane protein (TIGR04086 family)